VNKGFRWLIYIYTYIYIYIYIHTYIHTYIYGVAGESLDVNEGFEVLEGMYHLGPLCAAISAVTLHQ
jgi:hypothetical protein